MAEIDLMCIKYGITHRFTTPQWPQCNGMVERMIKTLKNGLSMVSFIDLDNWDLQLPRILFGYRCGVQVNTKFSPFMVMTGKPQGSHVTMAFLHSLMWKRMNSPWMR
jgi:hypothetical protein